MYMSHMCIHICLFAHVKELWYLFNSGMWRIIPWQNYPQVCKCRQTYSRKTQSLRCWQAHACPQFAAAAGSVFGRSLVRLCAVLKLAVQHRHQVCMYAQVCLSDRQAQLLHVTYPRHSGA